MANLDEQKKQFIKEQQRVNNLYEDAEQMRDELQGEVNEYKTLKKRQMETNIALLMRLLKSMNLNLARLLRLEMKRMSG